MEPWGREELLERLRSAVAAGRLPQSLLVHGPPGVGRRPLALWIARALQCQPPDRDGGGVPCGSCRNCRMAARLEHPDIHLHFPMPRPKKAASRAKLREAIEAQRHKRLGLLREDFHARLDPDAVTGLYVAAVENVRNQASHRPSMSRRSVFVIEDADRMVPQSANPEAANAFLKLLEEPPPYAFIVLTSARPEALLPTIRSRTVPLRLAPLPATRVAAYVAARFGVGDERALAVARRADGAVYRTHALVNAETRESSEAADNLLAAALEGTPQARYRAAARFTARGARGELEPALEDLRSRLRDMLCLASGAAEAALDPGRGETRARRSTVSDGAILDALAALDAASEGVARNLNPQATIAILLEAMGAAFSGQAAGTASFRGAARSL